MQSKGAIRFVAILLAIACVWQLSFTAVTGIYEKKAANSAEKAVMAAQETAEFRNLADLEKAYFLDSVRKVQNKWYIDSISAQKI